MTKRDFFRLVIKLFGLYSIVLSLFSILPSNISNLFIYKDEFWMIALILGSTIFVISLFLILLFKTDFIIEKLDLEKGFDDDVIILGDFKNEQIFKLGIIVIGGFLIIDYFPSVTFDVINIFKTKASNYTILGQEVDYYNFTVGVVNIIIGLLFITNYKNISSYLDKK